MDAGLFLRESSLCFLGLRVTSGVAGEAFFDSRLPIDADEEPFDAISTYHDRT